MNESSDKPSFDRDESYAKSARIIRWICLALVLITYPFHDTNGVVVFTMLALTAGYNLLSEIPAVRRNPLFGSRLISLVIDYVFVVLLIILSGGLASPYYPLFFLLILAVIAAYGIAGFAFSLSAQLGITLMLLRVDLTPQPSTASLQFTIKLVLLIAFSLVAEQSVRSRNQEYLLESRFTDQVKNERQRLLSLINSLSDAVLAVDEQGKVYLYNAAALELLNTNRDISGHEISELLPLRDPNKQKVNLLHLAAEHQRPVSRSDLYFPAGDGSNIILGLTISPVHIFDNNAAELGGYMVVFRDITKQKSLDEERDEFIAVTSHELRTPLAVAEANLSTALLPSFVKLPPKAKPLIIQAHENIVFLSQLIADLSSLSRAERGDLQLVRTLINVQELCEELIRDHHTAATAKKLHLKLILDKNPGSIYTSEPELREILQNLITNAIKYTNAGSVTLEVAHTTASTEFTVSDTGIGIAASDKTKIFAKFFRSEDYRTRATGGTGLGLYITHKLAEKLGIEISFSSRINQGSAFRLKVPNAPVSPAH